MAPHARGRAFGSAQRSAVRNTVRTYRRLLRECAGVDAAELAACGARVGERLERERSDLVAELEGIAAGAGIPAEDLLAVNARTELLAGRVDGGECTLAARLDGERVVIGQNWDWHPALAASMVLWTIPLAGGGWATTVTEAGMLGKLGLNASGIAVGLNFLAASADGGLGGVPVHALLRMVLDSTGSASEALALLLGAEVSASACITVAASEPGGGTLVAVELSPTGPSLAWPDANGVLVHANHFVAGPPAGRDEIVRDQPSSLLRHRHVLERIEGGASIEQALRSHYPRPHGVCRHDAADVPWAERRTTVLSLLADPAEGVLAVATGPPCTNEHRPVEVEP